MEAALLDLLEVRRGHFRYESGYHGDIWLDLDRLFAKPHALGNWRQCSPGEALKSWSVHLRAAPSLRK